MSSYLLEGLDFLSREKERKKIIKKEQFDTAPISTYDLEESPLEAALEDLDTYGLLSTQKVIIINNIETIKYDEISNDFDHLIKYIDNPNPDYLLIIEAKKLNNTLKTTKELKKHCTYIIVEVNTKKYIKDFFKDYKIDTNTISYLDEICQSDLTKIENECNKLKNYKDDTKVINKDDIDLLVVKKLGDSKDLTFAFTRSLAERDKKEALKKYHELLEYNIEPFSIIGLLASQIRIIYQVKLLEERHLSDREITKMLEEKSEYRIKKTRELTRYYSEKDLLELMQKIADMDLKLKSTDTDAKNLLELFILNI